MKYGKTKRKKIETIIVEQKKEKKLQKKSHTKKLHMNTHTHRWAYAENKKRKKIVETKNHFADEM